MPSPLAATAAAAARLPALPSPPSSAPTSRGTRRRRTRLAPCTAGTRVKAEDACSAREHADGGSRRWVATTAASSLAFGHGSAFASDASSSVARVAAEVSTSDGAWFGWYFAPGGFVLGPALLITGFLLGGAVFEKVTGVAVSSKPPKKK